MTRFYPVYARRSDGKIEIVSRGKRTERNEPTADQLDQRPDRNGASDFYREVPLEEAKNLDWRRKLGGMLAREMEHKDKNPRFGTDTSFMLVAFPENYRLYEHVKKTEKDGKLEVKSKTHAAGGNDRQDAYLYGYPAGRKKRFRSPAEFFPHLLWLCTDESGDPDNCSCKLCQPEEMDGGTSARKSKSKKAVVPLLQSDVKPLQTSAPQFMSAQPVFATQAPAPNPSPQSNSTNHLRPITPHVSSFSGPSPSHNQGQQSNQNTGTSQFQTFSYGQNYQT